MVSAVMDRKPSPEVSRPMRSSEPETPSVSWRSCSLWLSACATCPARAALRASPIPARVPGAALSLSRRIRPPVALDGSGHPRRSSRSAVPKPRVRDPRALRGLPPSPRRYAKHRPGRLGLERATHPRCAGRDPLRRSSRSGSPSASSPRRPDLEIAGRGSGAASENVYIQIQPERDALAMIEGTTRLVP